MALFADYEPGRHGDPPPAGLATRPATAEDVGPLAALREERGDVAAPEAAAFFERLLGTASAGDALLLVATVEDAVAGYGTAGHLVRPGLPAGWYLGGMIVAPAHRRRGIGSRLTRERLAWIASRATQAYYFSNERNRASIDLHVPMGFREVQRDLRVPGITFTNGIGLLFRADLRPRPR